MPYITLGTSSQLTIKVPTSGTTGWADTLKTDTFTKIAEHDHTGSGNGTKIAKAAINTDAIDGARILLDNNQYIRARNAANSADVNLIKLDTSDVIEIGNAINVKDSMLTIIDEGDATKKAVFSLGGATTAKTLTIISSHTDNRSLTLPDATDTLVGRATTDTLTNKTLTGNTAATLSPDGIETLTLPTATDTLVGRATTDTLTNKTISVDNNTISGIAASSFVLSNGSGNINGAAAQKAIPSGDVVGTTDSQTLTNKTLTGPSITGLDIDDNQFTVSDQADGTKELDFQLSGATTSTKTTVAASQTANRTVTLPDATDTLVGKATTDTLTNKTLTSPNINGSNLNFGTASNTNRLLLPNDTTTNLDALTDTAALIAYDTTLKKAVINDGTGWTPVGSGGGGLDVFYTEDFEAGVGTYTTGNNATFDNGGTLDGTLALETSAPISSTQSLKYTMGATSTNDWVASANIAVDKKQQTTVGIQGYYSYNGADNDIKLVGYDSTGTTVLTLATDFLKATSVPKRFSVQFPVPTTSSNIKWGFQVVTGNSGKILLIDDVEITTNPYVAKNLLEVTDWEDFTPTITNLATTGAVGKYKRVGDSAHIRIEADPNGVASGTITVSLPSGLSIDTAKLTGAGGTDQNLGTAQARPVNGATADVFTGFVQYSSSTTVQIYGNDSAGAGNLWSTNTPNTWAASGDSFSLDFTVPISGWTSQSEQVLAYNARNAENSTVKVGGTASKGSTGGVLTMTYNTTYEELGNAITYTRDAANGDSWLINEKGVYYLSLKYSGSTGGVSTASIAKNTANTTSPTGIGDANSLGGYIEADVALNHVGSSWSGILNQGDVIRVHTDGLNVGGVGQFTISKIGVGDLLGVPKPRVAYLEHRETSGTNGGTFTSGSYQTRTLNTISGNTEFVSLSSNQFTLSAGTYHIEATAAAYLVDANKLKVYNTTDASDAILGQNSFARAASVVPSNALLSGTVTITSSKTFELQHRATTTRASDGFGVSTAFGDSEVYVQVKIEKVN